MFKENSFLLSIALTLLLAGVIIYYVNSRFKNIETSLQKQNTILSDFITNFILSDKSKVVIASEFTDTIIPSNSWFADDIVWEKNIIMNK